MIYEHSSSRSQSVPMNAVYRPGKIREKISIDRAMARPAKMVQGHTTTKQASIDGKPAAIDGIVPAVVLLCAVLLAALHTAELCREKQVATRNTPLPDLPIEQVYSLLLKCVDIKILGT